MKKTFVFALCTGVCLPFFSACVDHEYDISDENLDKSAVISGEGIDVPLINELKISLKEQIDKLYEGEDLKWDDKTGLAYFTYRGVFPVAFPTFTPPAGNPVNTTIAIPNSINGSLPSGGPRPLGDVNADFDAKVSTDGGDIKISDIKKIAFKSMKTEINVKSQGLKFSEPAKATVKVTITFPNAFTLKPTEGLNGKVFTKEVSGSALESGHLLLTAEIEEIDYTGGSNFKIAYKAELTLAAAQNVTTNSPKLQFDVTTRDIDVDYMDAKVVGTQSFNDKIADFSEIKEAFEGKTLSFRNPALFLDFDTNLGADFTMDLTLNTQTLTSPMEFEKPIIPGQTKTTPYVLSPYQDETPAAQWKIFELDDMFADFPETVNYNIKLNVSDADAHISPTGTTNANYTFKLPFEFNEIELPFEEKLADVFDESMYDDIFKNLTGKYLEIKADMNVAITGMELELSAQILDGDNQDLNLISGNVLSDNKLSIKIDIVGDKKEKLKNARHLAFKFTLKGKATGSVFPKITDKDFISIENLSFASDGGLEVEIF